MYYLYRHFNDKNDLLYVGISSCPFKRTKNHSKTAKWFSSVSTIKIEKFDTKQEADNAETKAIFLENPKFNIRKKPSCDFVPTESQLKAEFYPTDVAAYYLKMSKANLYQKQHRQVGPNSYNFGSKIFYYKKEDLDNWKDQRVTE